MRKNIFLIGRQGHKGDENQLTDMLAYLFQEERDLIPQWLGALDLEIHGIDGWEVETQRSVPGGFLDLVLFSRGQALVIVESKLGSSTDFNQIAKYVSYAKSVAVVGPKALVFTTQSPEPWPEGVKEEAGEDVSLILRRWQSLGDFLHASDRPLAQDFAAMLEREGLVTPTVLTNTDWETWAEGHRIGRRLKSLLEEASADLQSVAPGFKKMNPVTFATTGAVTRSLEFDDLLLSVGFWPSRNPPNPEDHALVTVSVLNTLLPTDERKAAGQAAVERAASARVALSEWNQVLHTAPTHHVLTADDFREQCDQFVAHVREALDYFRDLDYLAPPAETLVMPSGDAEARPPEPSSL